jgi:hypothetical protein
MTLSPGGLPPWVRVRDKDTGYEYSVRYVQPEAHEQLFDDDGDPVPGSDDGDNPLPPVHDTKQALAKAKAAGSDLRGAELDQALADAGLPKSGTVGEKQARLAEHQLATADQEA